MPLRIRRSALAKQDQTDIWLFIAVDSISSADRLMDRFNDAFYLLSEYPESGRVRPEYAALRLYPVDQYNIFYRASSVAVEIIRILHAARDVTPDLLTE
jgi:toxin ParE1/3/4